MVMTFLPGSPAQTPMRDDLRRLALASPLDTYIANMAALAAYFPFDDTAGIYSRVVNPAVAEGRNLEVDGTMEATGTANYAVVGSATLSKQAGTRTGGSGAQVLRVASTGTINAGARQTNLVIGKLYHITGWERSDGVGTARIASAGVNFTGTTSTAWVQFDFYILATTAVVDLGNGVATNGGYVEYDDVSVTLVGIQASSAFPTTELVINPGFDWDVAWTKGANWTIAAGVAHAAAAAVGVQLTQAISMIAGRSYDITYTIANYVGGSVRVKAGSGAAGTTRSANGTYTETLTCTTTLLVIFDPITSAFTGDIDNISVVPHDGLIIYNGDGSTTTGWTAINSATLSSVSGWLRVAYNAVANASAAQTSLKIGSTYLLTIDMRGDGTAVPAVLNGTTLLTGTNSVSTQSLSVVFVATVATLSLRNTTSSGYVEFDNIVVTELPPMSGAPLNGTALNQTSGNALLDPVYSLDGVNDTVQLGSSTLGAVANPSGGFTWFGFVKPSSSAIWTDGVQHTILYAVADSTNNYIQITKNTTNNQMLFRFRSGGVTTDIVINGLSFTDWTMLEVTINPTTGEFKAFINGVLVVTQTGIGTFVGVFAATLTMAGATTTAGANRWSGWFASFAFFNAVLEPDVSLLLAELGGAA